MLTEPFDGLIGVCGLASMIVRHPRGPHLGKNRIDGIQTESWLDFGNSVSERGDRGVVGRIEDRSR